MRRYLAFFAVLAMLSMPLVASAGEETIIPPEANWTPTPPASKTVNTAGLTQLLVEKGVITRQEQAEILQRQSAMTAGQSQEMSGKPAASPEKVR
jgi:hypothetical protein